MLVPPELSTRTVARPTHPGRTAIVASTPSPGGRDPRAGETVTSELSEIAWKWSMGASPAFSTRSVAEVDPSGSASSEAETDSCPAKAAADHEAPHRPR